MSAGQIGVEPRDSATLNLVDVWILLLRGWRVIFGVTFIFACASIAISLVMTPIFRAQAVVAPVESDNTGTASSMLGQLGGLASLAGINLGTPSDGTTRSLGVLRSRALIEKFIETNNLLPVLYPGDPDPFPTLWRAVEDFRELYRVEQDPDSGLVGVTLDWIDPVLAAEWTNGLISLANEEVRQRDLANAEENIAYLNKELERTTVVELQQVAYNLIEAEMNTLMLANAHEEYAFTVIDPAVAPELRISPRRKQLVVLGTLLGGIVGICVIGLRRFLREVRIKETELTGTGRTL